MLSFHSSSHHFPLVYPALHPSIFIPKIHPSTLFCFHSFYSAITFIHPYFLSIQLFIHFFFNSSQSHPSMIFYNQIHPSISSILDSFPSIYSVHFCIHYPSIFFILSPIHHLPKLTNWSIHASIHPLSLTFSQRIILAMFNQNSFTHHLFLLSVRPSVIISSEVTHPSTFPSIHSPVYPPSSSVIFPLNPSITLL